MANLIPQPYSEVVMSATALTPAISLGFGSTTQTSGLAQNPDAPRGDIQIAGNTTVTVSRKKLFLGLAAVGVLAYILKA